MKKMCIRMSFNCDKCRRKAMEVAVGAQGVISVAIEGELEDELVVVGEGVDAVCLVDALRKKACYAILETLEEVKPDILPPDDDQMNPQEDNNTDESSTMEPADDDSCTKQTAPPHCCLAQHPTFYYEQPAPEMYQVVYESYGPTTGCTIM